MNYIILVGNWSNLKYWQLVKFIWMPILDSMSMTFVKIFKCETNVQCINWIEGTASKVKNKWKINRIFVWNYFYKNCLLAIVGTRRAEGRKKKPERDRIDNFPKTFVERCILFIVFFGWCVLRAATSLLHTFIIFFRFPRKSKLNVNWMNKTLTSCDRSNRKEKQICLCNARISQIG